MGVNYYLNVGEELLHIGKSSGGWKFMFEAHPEYGITSIHDYAVLIKFHIIVNSYGAIVYESEFWDLVRAKATEKAQGPEYHDVKSGLYWMDPTGMAEFYNYEFT